MGSRPHVVRCSKPLPDRGHPPDGLGTMSAHAIPIPPFRETYPNPESARPRVTSPSHPPAAVSVAQLVQSPLECAHLSKLDACTVPHCATRSRPHGCQLELLGSLAAPHPAGAPDCHRVRSHSRPDEHPQEQESHPFHTRTAIWRTPRVLMPASVTQRGPSLARRPSSSPSRFRPTPRVRSGLCP